MGDNFVNRLRLDAYTDLDVTDHKVDLQGWIDNANFERVFSRYVVGNKSRFFDKPMNVIEIGSWKGLSTSTMACICKASGVKANIIAVDTWLGAQEFWTWGRDDPTRGVSLRLVNGYPSIYYTFLKNMKVLGHDDTIAPLPLPSSVASDVLSHYGIKADVIYVDAAHDYINVKQDIEMYYSLLSDGGMIFGDDYFAKSWPGVCKAVDELIPSRKLDGVIWSHVKYKSKTRRCYKNVL